MLPRGRACARGAVGRARLGGAAPRAADARAARCTSSLPARRISIISCAAPRRTPTSSSAGSWRLRSTCRSWSGAPTCARMAGESGRSIEDAARTARYAFLNDAAAIARRRGHRRRPQPRGSGGNVPAAADSRCGAGAGSPGSGRAPARVIRPLLEIPRAELRAYAGGARPAFPRGLVERRRRHSAQPCPARAAAAPGAVLAGDCRDRWRARRRSPGRTTNFWRPLQSNRPRSIVLQEDNGVALDAAALAVLHPALASRVGADSSAGSCARPLHRFSARRRFAGPRRDGRTGAAVALPGLVATAKGTADRARRRLGGALCELFQRSVVYSR